MYMLTSWRKKIAVFIAFYAFSVQTVQAQGLTLQQNEASAVVIGSFNYVTLALIVLRYAIVSTLMVAAIVAIFQASLWIHHEGNMVKAYEAKESLAKAVIVITVCFIALSVFRYFIPDFTMLQF